MAGSLTWVDAFTDTAFAGNPAGVCLPTEPLSAEYMQALAKELGIAETAFVTPTAQPRHVRPALVLAAGGDRPVRSRHAGLGPCHARAWRGGRDASADVHDP